MTYTLRVISGERDALRTVLFQRLTDGESIEISAETDEQNLLAKLPEFLDAALEIQRALWPAQRVLSKVPSSFFPLLAEESRLVQSLTEQKGGAAARLIERRRTVRAAMIVRDVAWEALRDVVGPARRREVDALVGVNETARQVVESMESIAAFIERTLKDPREAPLLVACDIDAAYAASLRRHAALVRASEDAASDAPAEEKRPKRGLLRLIGTAYRALRSEAFMTIPALHTMAWMIEARSAARAHETAKRRS